MRNMLLALVLGGTIWAVPGWADDDDIIRVKAADDVTATMAALEDAVTGAGATVFAKVDHGAGAEGAGLALGASQLLIFGNPQLGTPAMQANPLAGLYLPLKVLVYEDAGGQVWLAYEEPEEMLDELDGIDDDAAFVEKMTGALAKLTRKAAGG